MSHRMRLATWLVPLIVLTLTPFLTAQYGDAQSGQSGMSDNSMGGPAMSVTGCLKQGSEKNGYYVTSRDGKVYELSGKADFSKHVNHTVTVAGHEMMMSKEHEAKVEEQEKSEASGKPYADIHVTALKHVSDSCSQ